MTFLVVDQYLVDVLGRQVGDDGERRPRRRLDRGGDTTAVIIPLAGRQDTFAFVLESRNVNLGTRPGMDPWLGEIATG
jgi:hypothetical protein